MIVFLFACQPFSPDILNIEDWKMGDPTLDPFSSHQPEEINCSISAFRVESEQLEIDTDLCNYAFIEFAALQNIPQGAPAELLLLHTGLWAPEAAEAHIALLLKDQVFWEITLPIPASAEFFFYEGNFPIPIQRNDPIYLHIHNHGANDWRLGYFNRKEN